MIRIVKASKHNLKDINLDIPRDKLVVITGISGSGKSTLAFGTIYAEAQRRYMESLSSYARQFLGKLDKPEVESIEGLSPAISIEQKTTHHNPRSTVGTITEIYDFLRIMFARIGKARCPECKTPVEAQSIDRIMAQVKVIIQKDDITLQVLSPIVKLKKGTHKDLLHALLREGFLRVRVDGTISRIEEVSPLAKTHKHTIELVIDRLTLTPDSYKENRTRLADSMELALRKGQGQAIISYQSTHDTLAKEQIKYFSTKLSCHQCDISFPEITHQHFSFNSPEGACISCIGIGASLEFHPELVISAPKANLKEHPFINIKWTPTLYKSYKLLLHVLSTQHNIDLDTPWYLLDQKIRDIILYGIQNKNKSLHEKDLSFMGLIPYLRKRYNSVSDFYRKRMEQYMVFMPCPKCHGERLIPYALNIHIQGKNIADLTHLSIEDIYDFMEDIQLTDKEQIIIKQALKEIKSRLHFLNNVGVGYLTLDRMSSTLSGGEFQRIRLATQIGSALVGVLYILDEPSIGLHQSDNARLIKTLRSLCDIGNTVLVVEHDEETIEMADHIIDIGVGAGQHGGYVIHNGDYPSLLTNKESLTGQYLSGKITIPVPTKRDITDQKYLAVIGAEENNLHNIDVCIPLEQFVCVTGISGSGKSTLVHEILYKALHNYFNPSYLLPGKYTTIRGTEYLDRMIYIDQSPLGRTSRSNPATYTDAFSFIRELFANLPASQARGYKVGRFSFNVRGGRCEDCQGDGTKKIEMHFLPDVYVACETCHGKRYNYETLEVTYKGKNIFEVLEMSVEEALSFFKNIPQLEAKLQSLYDVGMGYIKIGQPAPSLSGGEAQRVKLAKELSKNSIKKTIYILDEPTTGLHFDDIKKLLAILHRFVDNKNTVVIIEHNMDVIKTADWIIDLGPSGGKNGGQIVAEGTPDNVANNALSLTGQFLKKWLLKNGS